MVNMFGLSYLFICFDFIYLFIYLFIAVYSRIQFEFPSCPRFSHENITNKKLAA